jgi:hypothetical protein
VIFSCVLLAACFACRTSRVTHHTSQVTRHTSLVTRHASHVTHHTSRVSCLTSQVTGSSGGGCAVWDLRRPDQCCPLALHDVRDAAAAALCPKCSRVDRPLRRHKHMLTHVTGTCYVCVWSRCGTHHHHVVCRTSRDTCIRDHQCSVSSIRLSHRCGCC